MSEREQFEQEQSQSSSLVPQSEEAEQAETVQQFENEAQTEQQPDNGGEIEEPQRSDNEIYATPDVYQTQSLQEIYQTPDIDTEYRNTGGLFSGEHSDTDGQPGIMPYGGASGDTVQPNHDTYGSLPGNNVQGNSMYGAPTGNSAYGNNTYGVPTEGYAGGNAAYGVPTGNDIQGNNMYGAPAGSNVYGNMPNGAPAGNNAYGNMPNGAPAGNDPYGNMQPGSNTYGKKEHGNNQYRNDQYGSNYGNNPYGNPYGPDSYGYNPYSPYAVPPRKKNTGLIIGVIIGISLLFLTAVFALIGHALGVIFEKEKDYEDERVDDSYRDYDEADRFEEQEEEDDAGRRRDDHNDYDDYDRDYFDDHNDYDDYDRDYFYDDYDDFDYDDDEYYNYDDDEYYTLHDDIKDLSYSIDWNYWEYEEGGDNVMIAVEYPEVVGGRIPNRDWINDALKSEISFFTDYYEQEYSKYIEDGSSYFYVSAVGYVTYMSEDILSVVFSETVYSDYYDSITLYCINIDLENGVVLENTDILSVDDDFSVDFRYRSQKQNGSVDALDRLSDQEITQMFMTPGNLIVFYTPQGMEIGLNHDEGYVTVTYHEYEDYLKTF